MISHQLFLPLLAWSVYTVSAGGKHLIKRQEHNKPPFPIVTSTKVITQYSTVVVTKTINFTLTSICKVTPAPVPTTPAVTVTVTETTTIGGTVTETTPKGSAGQSRRSSGVSN